jgi:hypothetical protein
MAFATEGECMNILTADASLPETILNVGAQTAIQDTQGKLLGFYSPVVTSHVDGKLVYPAEAAAYAQAAAHVDPAELKRRKESGEREYPTVEVLEHLKSTAAAPRSGYCASASRR